MRTRWFSAILANFVIVAAAYAESPSIQITAPAKNAAFKPGTSIKIEISIPPGLPVAKVTYTLLEEDRALEDKVEPPPSSTSEVAPFEAELPIPQDAVGPYRLLAVAQVRERRGFYVLFDETSLSIVPDVPLQALRSESPVRFTKTIGEVQILAIRGLYADRVVRDLTSSATGTSYRSSDPSIVRVNADGRAQALGEGTAEITARNQGKEDRIRAIVAVRNTENRPPVAHAGPDQTVKQGSRVRLDAIESADPEGENPFYYWSQVNGLPVDLVEPLSLRPYFTAPVVLRPHVLRFRLIVKDKEEAESFPAYVNVTVVP
ncbi:MAG TPA: hypothetical protein VGJ57_04305 [Nitrospirales bacterium]|jgi:hypothetical protein